MSVRKLLNPDAASSNILVGHTSKSGCCGEALEFCKYTVEATITNVTAITLLVGGSAVVVTFDAAANTPREVRVAIQNALKAQGYDPFYTEDMFKGVQVESDRIDIIGEAEVQSITVDGVTEAATKLCTDGAVCKWVGEIAYSTDIAFSTTATGATQTATGAATGNAATLETNIEGALTALGLTFKSVTVTEDVTNSVYTYEIHLIGTGDLYANGTILTHCGCYPDYVAA